MNVHSSGASCSGFIFRLRRKKKKRIKQRYLKLQQFSMTHAPPWLFSLPPPWATYQIPATGEITGGKYKFCKNRKYKQGQNVSISTFPAEVCSGTGMIRIFLQERAKHSGLGGALHRGVLTPNFTVQLSQFLVLSSSEHEIIPMQLPDSFSVASHPSGWLPGWTWLNARD